MPVPKQTPSGRATRLSAFHVIAFFVLSGVLTASVQAAGANDTTGDRKTPTAVFDCNAGPWGDLEYVRITLEPPDHYALDSLSYVKSTRWFFKRYNREQLTHYFESLLTAAEQDEILHKSMWQVSAEGIWIQPRESFVIKLDEKVRTQLYQVLASWPENGLHQTPFIFRRETLDERFSHPGISDKTVRLVKSMIYPKGTLLAFSDLPAVVSQIKDSQEKIRLLKVLSRKSTLMLRLKVTPQTDISRLVEYWGSGGRAKDLRPLLESLARVDGGFETDIAHLLPPFARQRLYTYPSPSATKHGPPENCHWTSFNFFSAVPDDGPKEPRALQKIVDQDYDVVNGEKRLGDVVLVMDSSDAILHSAVYIADDIVFTKTGARENQPWILMKMDDMLPLYASANQPLRVAVCRKKSQGDSVIH